MNRDIHSVCVDARLISAPGIGTYLKNLFSQFRHTSWKWSALVNPENANRLSAWDYIEPIVVSSAIYSIKEQFELPLKIPRVDVFWSPHYNVPCAPIRARRRLVTIHDVFHLAYSATLRPAERLYAKCMMQAAMRLSDHIITDSAFSKSEIEKYAKLDRPMTVIHLGIDSDFSPNSDNHSESVMRKYGIVGSFVLYVGSFKAHKNLKGLIEAFFLLVKGGKENLKLVVVGGGQGMRHCEDVKQLCIAYPELEGKLYFVGQVSDEELPHFYRHAELFVFPSFYEGFGLPPLEAMGSGCPTVVARAGAMPEVCGEGAVYVDPHIPEQIAGVAKELLQDQIKRKELAERGLERAKQFCWKKSAEAHCSVIERLMR